MGSWIVTIKDRQNRIAQQKQTMVVPSRKGENLGRRRPGPFINFYDLGQHNTGTVDSPVWVTNPYTKTPTLTFDGFANLTSIEHFFMSDFADLEDSIFAVPLADWQTTYRKLEYDTAHKYGLDVAAPELYGTELKSGSNYQPIAKSGDRREKLAVASGSFPGYTASPIVSDNKWTAKGLKPFAAGNRLFTTLIGSMFSAAYWAFDQSGYLSIDVPPFEAGNIFYVTTTRGGDLTGAPTTVEVDKPLNVYLMPEVFFTYHDHLSDSGNKRHILNMLYHVAPRDEFLNYRVFEDSVYDPSLAYRYPFETMTTLKRSCLDRLEDSTGEAAWWSWQKNLPDARYKICDTSAHTITDGDPTAFPEVADGSDGIVTFNQQGILMPDGSLKGVVLPWKADPISPGSGTIDATYDNTHLLMVINQGDNWFYLYSANYQSGNGLLITLKTP